MSLFGEMLLKRLDSRKMRLDAFQVEVDRALSRMAASVQATPLSIPKDVWQRELHLPEIFPDLQPVYAHEVGAHFTRRYGWALFWTPPARFFLLATPGDFLAWLRLEVYRASWLSSREAGIEYARAKWEIAQTEERIKKVGGPFWD